MYLHLKEFKSQIVLFYILHKWKWESGKIYYGLLARKHLPENALFLKNVSVLSVYGGGV